VGEARIRDEIADDLTTLIDFPSTPNRCWRHGILRSIVAYDLVHPATWMPLGLLDEAWRDLARGFGHAN
jgi:hypothetical protein